MNLKLSEEFGQYFVRLPLTKSPRIHHGNALDVEWRDVATPVEVTYLVGNPPFVGAKFLNDQQREEPEPGLPRHQKRRTARLRQLLVSQSC
jgi:hypothetical protein